jgi:hypothetical protein
MVKPAPETAAEVTVTGAVPVDVSVNDCVVGVFTVALPKLRLEVLTASCGLVGDPGDDAAAPVPARATIAGLPLAELLTIAICPLAAPADAGLNCTCSVAA